MFKLADLFFVVVAIQTQIHFSVGDENANCQGNGWENSTKSGEFCYAATNHLYYYSYAQEYCLSIGGNLASIHSSSENKIVFDLCKNDDNYGNDCWIGMHKMFNKSWGWHDGTQVDYNNWHSNSIEDDDVCTVMDYYSGDWYPNSNKNINLYGICKKQDDSPTIVSATSTPKQQDTPTTNPTTAAFTSFSTKQANSPTTTPTTDKFTPSSPKQHNSPTTAPTTAAFTSFSTKQDNSSTTTPTTAAFTSFRTKQDNSPTTILTTAAFTSFSTKQDNSSTTTPTTAAFTSFRTKQDNSPTTILTTAAFTSFSTKQDNSSTTTPTTAAFTSFITKQDNSSTTTPTTAAFTSFRTKQDNSPTTTPTTAAFTSFNTKQHTSPTTIPTITAPATSSPKQHDSPTTTPTTTVSTTSSTKQHNSPTTIPTTATTSHTSPTTTSATTTSTPQSEGGCSRFTRDRCREPESSALIDKFYRSDTVQCQEACFIEENCHSFVIEHETEICSLYTTDVVGMEDCQYIGGPHYPAISTCQQQGCQDFFKSSCDHEMLEILTFHEGISQPTHCEAFCQKNHECRQWMIVSNATCELYWNKPICKTFSGPKQPKFKLCK